MVSFKVNKPGRLRGAVVNKTRWEPTTSARHVTAAAWPVLTERRCPVMATQDPLWKQFVAAVARWRRATLTNTRAGRLKTVSEHPEGWSGRQCCTQVWGVSRGERCTPRSALG